MLKGNMLCVGWIVESRQNVIRAHPNSLYKEAQLNQNVFNSFEHIKLLKYRVDMKSYMVNG